MGKGQGCSNLPDWKGASAVYRKAYKHMRENGPDYDLIDALNTGNEEDIKRCMLNINTEIVLARQKDA